MSTVAQGTCLSEEQSAVLYKRHQLWESGYRPLAVHTRGKKPFGNAWTERARQNPPAAITEPLSAQAGNTGILCDGLRAVDCDIDDPAVANEIARLASVLLGQAPIRKRADSARCLLLYRAVEGEPGKRDLSGTIGRIEVLGRGQQFVAYGDHPTGTPYSWTHDPAPYSRELLTAVTETQLAAFFEAVAPIIGAASNAIPSPQPVEPISFDPSHPATERDISAVYHQSRRKTAPATRLTQRRRREVGEVCHGES